MHIRPNDVPIKVNAPGAVARQQTDCSNASNYGKIGAEYFKMDAGTDIAPLLQGLKNDHCQAPHWGYLNTMAFDRRCIPARFVAHRTQS